jgi:hypothetical protein
MLSKPLGSCFRDGPAVAAALFFSVASAASGEVRSGIWTWLRPADSLSWSVDFSEMERFCSGFQGTPKCSLRTADCRFGFDSIYAPNGLFYDSATAAALETGFIYGRTINQDRQGLFYLDSMMKILQIKAPSGPFRDKISSLNRVFFVRTSEHRFAVMIMAGQYIGGIERLWYYWAYQPDSAAPLFKNRLVEPPPSLTIRLDVFSGRPNPVFTLTDPEGIAEIVHQIDISLSTLLDSTIIRKDTGNCPSILGYRGLSVSGMSGGEEFLNAIQFIDVCRGKLQYLKGASSAMSSLVDKDSRLEKLIIRVCCERDLDTTDQYGTIRFRDLVPDSLKPHASAAPERAAAGRERQSVRCRIHGREVRFQSVQPRRARIDFLSLTGKCLATIQRDGPESGEFSVAMRDDAIGRGAYIIRFSYPGQDGRSMFFPAFIYY